MRERYDVVIVGGGSAGCALANRLSADSTTTVLLLEAGRSDVRIDPFIHMPAALPIPIGNPLYDWRYRTDPEPHLNNRRVYHARGKVLGGSSSINGMIFQRGNPLDYERWARRGRPEGVGLRPLPALLQADGEVAAARRQQRRRPVARWRRAAGPRAWSGREPALRCVLRGDRAGRLPPHRRPQRLPPGGFCAVRPQPPPRPSPVRSPCLPPPGPRASQPDGPDLGPRHRRALLRQPGRRRRLPPRRTASAHRRRRRGDLVRRRDRQPAAAPALRSRRRVVAAEPRHPGRPAPAGCGRERPGPPRGLRPARLEAAGVHRPRPAVAGPAGHRLPVALPPPRPRRDQPLRGRRLRAQQRRRRLPQPDVPLPPGGGPLRRLGADRGPRLPGARRPDVRRHAGLGADPLARSRGAPLDPVQLPLHRRPTGASGSRRSG